MSNLPHDFQGAVSHFVARCRQHLQRALFSYRAAADVLEHTPDAELTDRYGPLVVEALGHDLERVDRRDRMLARSHLALQRHNFELFLSRLAAVKWEYHREEVLRRWARPIRVPPDTVGAAAAPLPPFALGELNAPQHGLIQLTDHLRLILGVAKPFATWAGLDRRVEVGDLQVQIWSQLEVAFRVRHLYEHRDARVDRTFRNAAVSHWGGTSWRTWGDAIDLDRQDERGLPVRLPIRQVDFLATTEAMLEAAPAIGAAIAGTGAGQQI